MKKQQGQSLVEMIVVIGIVVLLTTGIVVGTTTALSRSKTSQVRSDALSFAQAGVELARGIRDSGWVAFAAMGTPQTTYCVGLNGTFVAQTCSAPNINNTFTRSIILQSTTVSGVSTMKVTSRVVWGVTSNASNVVQLITYLTQWR